MRGGMDTTVFRRMSRTWSQDKIMQLQEISRMLGRRIAGYKMLLL